MHLGCKPAGVATTPVRAREDVRRFFDDRAASYVEQHGHAARLLAYRLGLVRVHAHLRPTDVVLDVGCGPGDHLLALASEIARGLGVDLSPGMIEAARVRQQRSPWPARVSFAVDDAAELGSVASQSVDLALCIGALEHMLDQPAVLASIRRTLKPGGRLFCLTPDGDYLWYRALAPLLGIATRHLSTDTFLSRAGLRALLAGAGFARIEVGAWTFIPKGDMPALAGQVLEALALIGRVARLPRLRGGLWVCAWNG